MKISHSILLAASLAFTGTALAQQQSLQPAAQPSRALGASQQQPQLTPEQQAQRTRQDAEISKAADQIVQLVDQNKTGEVWDGASAVAKSAVTRESFVQQIASDRRKLGAPVTRTRVATTRAAYGPGDQVPAGNYINVVIATKFANVPDPVRELVSFHFDDDKIWRVSGYSLR